MRFILLINVQLLLCLLIGLTSVPSKAETKPGSEVSKNFPPGGGEITLEILDNKIKTVTEKQGLPDAVKNKVISDFQTAKDNLESIIWFKSQTTYYQDALQTAPIKIKNFQAEISRAEANAQNQSTENFQAIPTDELEQRYIIEKSKLSDVDDEIIRLETEITVQNNRPQLIRSETATTKQELDAAQQKFQSMLSDSQTKPETESSQLNLKTLIDAHTAELKMYDFEAISNPIRMQLLKVNLQLLSLKKQVLEPTISAIEEQLAIRRQQEAYKMHEELSQVEKEVQDKDPVIQTITKENIQYSRDLQAITLKMEQYGIQKTKVDTQTDAIKTDFKSAEKKISLAGLSPALGKILREQRRSLNFKDDFDLKSETLQNETAAASLEQFKVEDRLKQLTDIDGELKRLITEHVSPDLPAEQRLRIKAELRILLNNQKDLLNKLGGVYVDYLRTLGDYDFARQQLQNQANQYAAYLDKRLLWVPSSMPIDLDFPLNIYQSGKWLFSPTNWLILSQDTLKTFINHPILGSIALLSLIILQVFKKQLKTSISDFNNKVLRPSTDHFTYTLIALAYTLVLVAPLALLLNYLGWFLSSNMQLAAFTKAIGAGLQKTAMPLFFLQFFHHLFAPEGIARKHFHWRKNPIALIRKLLTWVIYCIVPSMFIINMTNIFVNVAHTDNLGRLALIIAMLTLSVVLGTLFHPKYEIFPKRVRENPKHLLTKLRFIWYPLAIIIPLIIIGFAASGYYLSALELQDKLIITLRMLVTAIIVHEIVVRWLTVVNRQLASQNAQAEQLATELKQASGSAPAGLGGEIELKSRGTPSPVPELLDIPEINAQTLKILNVIIMLSLFIGGWVVWRDIVPAFSFLDQVILWHHAVIVDAQQVFQPVTLTNLLFSGVSLIIAFITVRNLPGVMELLVFQYINVESGSRYAINQLSKYFILVVVIIMVANELGGSWSQVQWLAAALSVGLGFGLQEIFANLVSGIILLFERPIRVGDTVTVGETTGTVNRIQMRATTLFDYDQKELIVPNKTFLTDQLVNWTLTDPVTRIVIPVGIAYGSDIELAHKIMLDTIKSIPQILSTPAPSAFFLGFGDSSLDFSVRIFVGNLSDRLPATHEFHLKLDRAFREHNINIPFPQRDVHLYKQPD